MGFLKKEVFLDEFVAKLTLALINAPKGFSSNWWVSGEGLSPKERKKAEKESDYIFFTVLFLLINNRRESGKIKQLPSSLTGEEYGARIGEILYNSLLITYKYLNNTQKEAEKMASDAIEIIIEYLGEVEGDVDEKFIINMLGIFFANRIVRESNPNYSNLCLLGAQFVEKVQKEIAPMLFKDKLIYRPHEEFKNVVYKI